MPDLFSSPSEVESASSDFPDVKDLKGRLLIISPTAYRSGEDAVETKFGKKDAVVATVIVVDEDDPAKSEQFEGMHFLQGRIIGKTKGLVGSGRAVLARLGQTPTDKGNPAWTLEDPAGNDGDLARKAYDALNEPPF